MFIEPDEHIIVMEDDINYPWSVDDLRKIENSGVKTIMLPHSFYIEDKPFQIYRKAVDMIYDTNFKILLPFGYSDLKMTMESYVEYKEVIDIYLSSALYCLSDLQERVQLIYAVPEGGEFLWDATLTKNYPLSDEEIAEFVIGRQRILERQYGEIWLCAHNFLGHHNNWNNTRLPYLYQALRDEFPNTPFYSLQFAHFSCGGTPTSLEQQYKVKEYKDRFGIRFFVGSDYCEGLTKNLDEAMKQEVYGFVTSPMHQENPIKHTQVEDWMVKELQDTNRKINDYHKI